METIDAFLKGENIPDETNRATTSEATSSSQTTTMALTTTTTPQLATVKEENLTTVPIKIKKAEKPDSNRKGNNEDLTIEKVLHDYGVTKPNIGFVLDAIYTIVLSIVLLVIK